MACKGLSVQLTSPGFSIQCGRRIPAGIFLGSFLSSTADSVSDCVARCTADSRCLAFSLYNPEKPASPVCSELVMAAPDVDTNVFRSKLDQFRSVATNITMYASSADKALLASGVKTFGTRAGYVPDNGPPNIFPGIEVIDVTAVGDDMLGHGTYASSRAVLEDLAHLTRSLTHLPPHARIPTLKFMPDKANVQYWLYPR